MGLVQQHCWPTNSRVATPLDASRTFRPKYHTPPFTDLSRSFRALVRVRMGRGSAILTPWILRFPSSQRSAPKALAKFAHSLPELLLLLFELRPQPACLNSSTNFTISLRFFSDYPAGPWTHLLVLL